MAKTSIYLPDDLAEQVRAHGIAVSEVAQAALRQAVKDAEINENVMTDIQAVAERLRANRGEVTETDQARAAKARAYGDKWARTTASEDDLGYVVTYSDPPEDFRTPLSLVAFLTDEHQREHRAEGGTGLPGLSGMPGQARGSLLAGLPGGRPRGLECRAAAPVRAGRARRHTGRPVALR